MYRKSLFSTGSENFKSSIKEIQIVYEQTGNDADLTIKKLSDKFQEREVQSIIDSLNKIKNPDIRIEGYQKKLKYLLWTVLLLTALPVPFLYNIYDLSPLIFSLTSLFGILPIVIAIVVFYSKIPTTYNVIFFIYLLMLLFFSSTDELIDGIFDFTFEPVFLMYFSLFLILTVSKISVLYYSFRLLKLDDTTTRYVSKHLES